MIKHTIKKILHYLTIPLITLTLFRPVIAGSGEEKAPDLGKEYQLAAKEIKSWFRKSHP